MFRNKHQILLTNPPVIAEANNKVLADNPSNLTATNESLCEREIVLLQREQSLLKGEEIMSVNELRTENAPSSNICHPKNGIESPLLLRYQIFTDFGVKFFKYYMLSCAVFSLEVLLITAIERLIMDIDHLESSLYSQWPTRVAILSFLFWIILPLMATYSDGDEHVQLTFLTSFVLSMSLMVTRYLEASSAENMWFAKLLTATASILITFVSSSLITFAADIWTSEIIKRKVLNLAYEVPRKSTPEVKIQDPLEPLSEWEMC